MVPVTLTSQPCQSQALALPTRPPTMAGSQQPLASVGNQSANQLPTDESQGPLPPDSGPAAWLWVHALQVPRFPDGRVTELREVMGWFGVGGFPALWGAWLGQSHQQPTRLGLVCRTVLIGHLDICFERIAFVELGPYAIRGPVIVS